MYYSYRGKNGTLPGLRLATSADGKTWKRHYNQADPRGMGHIFASTPNAYYEWHQAMKVADTYVLTIEVGTEKGKRWRPVVAVSRAPDTGWKQLDVDTLLRRLFWQEDLQRFAPQDTHFACTCGRARVARMLVGPSAEDAGRPNP